MKTITNYLCENFKINSNNVDNQEKHKKLIELGHQVCEQIGIIELFDEFCNSVDNETIEEVLKSLDKRYNIGIM